MDIIIGPVRLRNLVLVGSSKKTVNNISIELISFDDGRNSRGELILTREEYKKLIGNENVEEDKPE